MTLSTDTIACPIQAVRRAISANGYRPVEICNYDSDPKRSPGKRPVRDAWQVGARLDPPDATVRPATADALNTGIECSGLCAIDIDMDDFFFVDIVRSIVEEHLGKTIVRTRADSPRSLLLYRAAAGEPRKVAETFEAEPKNALEALGAGNQFVAFGRHHATGAHLEWLDGSPLTVARDALPTVTVDQVAAVFTRVRTFFGATTKGAGKVGATTKPAGKASAVAPDKAAGFTAPPSEAKVVELLAGLPHSLDVDRTTYAAVMMAAVACVEALGGDVRDLDGPIAAAAIDWAERYEATDGSDERAKWLDDWSKRRRQLAGWQTLLQVNGKLNPGTALEFDALPPGVVDPGAWRSMLFRTKAAKDGAEGAIRPGLPNTLVALRHAPAWQGVLCIDDFEGRLCFARRAPWMATGEAFARREARDDDFTRIVVWMAGEGIVASSQQAFEAAAVVGRDNAFNSARDWLDALVWDGTARLDTWLIEHLGARDTPLHRAVGSKFLISAVARVREPGCQVDSVLTLEGAQGIGKSSSLRALAGSAWFTDHMPDLHNKDALQQMQGKLIIEHAEMDKIGRNDLGRVKAFLSTRVDRFRPPYGRVPVDVPRQCVFAASINPGAIGYLRDETGNRRYWPVACGQGWADGRKVDGKALAAVRDQLWAEAARRHAAGEAWHLDTRALEADQADAAGARLEVDVWTDVISDIVTGRPYVTTATILGDIRLMIETKAQNRATQMRVATVLLSLGWRSAQRRVEGSNRNVYLPPRDAAVPATVVRLVPAASG